MFQSVSQPHDADAFEKAVDRIQQHFRSHILGDLEFYWHDKPYCDRFSMMASWDPRWHQFDYTLCFGVGVRMKTA